jgi:hypothetical protein
MMEVPEKSEKAKGKQREKVVEETEEEEETEGRRKRRRTKVEKEEAEWRKMVEDGLRRAEERDVRRERRDIRVAQLLNTISYGVEQIVQSLRDARYEQRGREADEDREWRRAARLAAREEREEADGDEEMAVAEAVAEGSGGNRENGETERNGGDGETGEDGGNGETEGNGGNGGTEQGGDVEMA